MFILFLFVWLFVCVLADCGNPCCHYGFVCKKAFYAVSISSRIILFVLIASVLEGLWLGIFIIVFWIVWCLENILTCCGCCKSKKKSKKCTNICTSILVFIPLDLLGYPVSKFWNFFENKDCCKCCKCCHHDDDSGRYPDVELQVGTSSGGGNNSIRVVDDEKDDQHDDGDDSTVLGTMKDRVNGNSNNSNNNDDDSWYSCAAETLSIITHWIENILSFIIVIIFATNRDNDICDQSTDSVICTRWKNRSYKKNSVIEVLIWTLFCVMTLEFLLFIFIAPVNKCTNDLIAQKEAKKPKKKSKPKPDKTHLPFGDKLTVKIMQKAHIYRHKINTQKMHLQQSNQL